MATDPCQAIRDAIDELNNDIANLREVLDRNFPPLTKEERAKANQQLQADKNKLAQKETELLKCVQQNQESPESSPACFNMMDSGCPGRWLDTSCSTSIGSNEIVVADPGGWKIGSGVAVYNPVTLKGFKGRIVKIDGDRFTLDSAAPFTSATAVVSNDDSVVYAAVYAQAKAAGGGTVFWPGGLYRIGVKNDVLPTPAFTNTPLFVSSKIKNIGEGIGATVLKLADEVNMVGPRFNPMPPYTACYIGWTCGPVFINEGNPWWFDSPPWDSQIEIGCMTIDGNKENQSRVYKPFFSGPSPDRDKDAIAVYPDSMYYVGIVAQGGSLDANGFYDPFVRFMDSNGVEGPPNVYGNYRLKDTGDPNSNAMRLFLPPPTVWPSDAVSIAIYMGRFDSPELTDSPTNERDLCGNPRFERLDPIPLSAIPKWDRNPDTSHWPSVDVLSHTHYAPGPMETQGNYRVPGRITYPGDGSASSSMFFSQIKNLWVHDLESVNAAIDGILLEDLLDAVFERVWSHHCGRWCLGTAQTVFRNIAFTDCVFEGAESGGCDLEPASCDGVAFTRCVFRNNNGLGISIGAVGTLPAVDLSFFECTFENNGLWNLTTQGSTVDVVHLMVDRCIFRGCNNSNLAIGSGPQNKVDVTIINSVFDQACGHPSITPPYQIEGRDSAQIEISGPHSHVRVINCDFLPFSDGTHHSSNGGINLGDTTGGHAFIGNRYHSNPLDVRPPAVLGEGWSTAIRNQHFLFAASSDVLRACKLVGNVGDAYMWCGKDRVALDFQEAAALVPVDATDTSLAVKFATGMPGDGKWQPKVTFAWNCGSWWATDKTNMGFTIRWVTPPGVGGSTLDWTM
jgi:hypothetical protein